MSLRLSSLLQSFPESTRTLSHCILLHCKRILLKKIMCRIRLTWSQLKQLQMADDRSFRSRISSQKSECQIRPSNSLLVLCNFLRIVTVLKAAVSPFNLQTLVLDIRTLLFSDSVVLYDRTWRSFVSNVVRSKAAVLCFCFSCLNLA